MGGGRGGGGGGSSGLFKLNCMKNEKKFGLVCINL